MKRLVFLLLLLPLFVKAQTITTFLSTPFATPLGIAKDTHGNIYVAQFDDNNIIKLDAGGGTTVICGSPSTLLGYSGDGGPATSALLNGPTNIVFDNNNNLYIADAFNNVIRKVDTFGIITTYAGKVVGFETGGYSGDGGPADSAQLSFPTGVAVDAAGNVYIADDQNNVIRKVDAAGIITTVAGTDSSGTGVSGYTGDGGPATSARLFAPGSLVLGTDGSMYITDGGNNVIRKVDGTGTISTFAGTGIVGYSGDGGAATSAELSFPQLGIVFDAAGNLYFTEANNNVIRMVNTAGIISTVACSGVAGYAGDNGPADSAQCFSPEQMLIDSAGNIFFCDGSNDAIREVSGISGTTFICTGDSVVLNARAPGGVWHSSATTTASVTAAGVVTGVAAGNAIITYVAGGDTATALVHVNVTPDAGVISGIDTICLGNLDTLSSTITGGYWTIVSPSVVKSGNVVIGLVGGVDTIHYTIPYSCGLATTPYVFDVIDNYPGDISGPDTICVGDTYTYTETVTGGEWNMYDSVHATLVAPGVVKGLVAGEDFIGYSKNGPAPDCYRIRYFTIEVVYCPDGVTNVNGSHALSVFPNPAHTQLIISYGNKIHDVLITSLVGQTVYHNTFDDLRATIDVASLPAGVYLIHINNTEVRKFVKE